MERSTNKHMKISTKVPQSVINLSNSVKMDQVQEHADLHRQERTQQSDLSIFADARAATSVHEYSLARRRGTKRKLQKA